MNKVFWQIPITITFILTACGQSTPAPQATPQPDQPITTSSPLPTATPTRTALPSPTPTASITPLPTIPTFTPTFDVSTIITVTPAPQAECPTVNTSLKAEFYVPSVPSCLDTDMCVFSGTDKEILSFLNSGGSANTVVSKLRTADNGKYDRYAYRDLTGDNVADLMFVDFGIQKQIHIFYCSNGKYEVFTLDTIPFDFDSSAWKPMVEDLNQNNLPEILFFQGYGISCCRFFTLEWDGTTFKDLSPNGYTEIPATIENIDKNSTREIVGGASTEVYPVGLNRFGTLIFSWDGNTFELVKESFPSPTFRIQAIYDGNWEMLNQEYNKSLISYQLVINDLTLDYWSDERALYEFRNWESRGASTLTDPTPVPDLTEYPRLAAYAYYRIMLLHIVQGNELDATTIYSTLQEKFGNDQYSRPYVEMASAFWEAYQSTHKMYAGCAAAIQYAAEHPDILIPLGSDYHGWQSHQYKPEDVCPFR